MASDADFEPRTLPAFPPMDESGWVDISQIEYNLSLTVAQRIEQYFQWMEFVEIAREAGRKMNGVDTRPIEAAE